MRAEVRRRWETRDSVCGELWVDGQFECYTLEPARADPVNAGHPLIPAGAYKVILTPSPRLGYVTPELLGVPGRADIRWHVGNWPKDTLGCVLVGMHRAEDIVKNSKGAFDRLMILLRTADSIEAEYKEEIECPS